MSSITFLEFDLKNSTKPLIETSSKQRITSDISYVADEKLMSDLHKASMRVKELTNITQMTNQLVSEVIILEKTYKKGSGGNTIKNTLLQKVGAVGMNVPTPFTLYVKEIDESLKDGWSVKLLVTAVVTAIISWLGLPIINLMGGVVLLAILDVVLSLIPGNIKQGTEKDHNLQAKVWRLITNIIGIVAVVVAHDSLSQYSTDGNLFSLVAMYFHYVVIGWIMSIYAYQIVKYIARANRVSIPGPIASLFKWDKK